MDAMVYQDFPGGAPTCYFSRKMHDNEEILVEWGRASLRPHSTFHLPRNEESCFFSLE